MKKVILFFTLLFTGIVQSHACSCFFEHYCTFIRDSSVQVAVQAKVINSVIYGQDNYAVYMKVIKNYKEETHPVTDTIKVYGNDWEASCFVNVLNYFPVGDTVIVGFTDFEMSPEVLFNPDSLTEHYTEVRPILCGMVSLAVQNATVYGLIHPGVNSFPLSHFQNALTTCDFSITTGVSEEADSDFRLFPNPSQQGKMYLLQENLNDPVDRVLVYAADGRLVREYRVPAGQGQSPIELEPGTAGMYWIEIHCGAKTYFRKAMVLNTE